MEASSKKIVLLLAALFTCSVPTIALADDLNAAAERITRDPFDTTTRVLAAEATRDGHWRLVNRAGERLLGERPLEEEQVVVAETEVAQLVDRADELRPDDVDEALRHRIRRVGAVEQRYQHGRGDGPEGVGGDLRLGGCRYPGVGSDAHVEVETLGGERGDQPDGHHHLQRGAVGAR